MTSTLRPRGTYSGTGLKKRPLKSMPKRWIPTLPPTGFGLEKTPTKISPGVIEKKATDTWNEAVIPSYYASLLTWANRNSLQLTPTEFSMIRYNTWTECYVWSKFTVTYTTTKLNNEKYLGSHNCGGCKKVMRAGEMMCSNCTTFASCPGCFTAGLTLHGIPGTKTLYCARCAVECSSEACSELVGPHDTLKQCAKCCPRAACHICTTVYQSASLSKKTFKDQSFDICTNCSIYICEECGCPDKKIVSKKIGTINKKLCTECVQKIYDKERKKFESWSKDELPPSGTMVVPSSRTRPIRTISIETEFDGDGVAVAKALYRSGLIESPRKNVYSSQSDVGRRLPCLLKSDSSVTGGELVTYLIDLDNENHAAALLRMTEVMRGCQQTNQALFSYKAGGHIHIDLHGFSIEDLWTYYTVFKYLEMPLYYLAGAGASYGHRSLSGSSYANPPSGGPYGTKEAFAQSFRRGGRSGLNLSNFNGALQSCACGAIITGDWKKCSCNLGKATAEWRLWNAEITPRILHAWIALMQSITAYAADNPCNESSMPYLNWRGCKFTALKAEEKTKVKERLEWMHRELPLTHDERDSIVYAAKKSQLIDLGASELNGLMNIQSTAGTAEKENPRNPSSRKNVKFEMKELSDREVATAATQEPLQSEYQRIRNAVTNNFSAPRFSDEYF